MFSIGFNNSNLTFNPTTSSKVTYPFISWDNVFNNEEIKDVLSYFDKQPVEESILKNPTSNQIVRRFKTRNHSFNSVNADNRWILEGLRNAADAINKEFFRFDLSGIETFQYTVYYPLCYLLLACYTEPVTSIIGFPLWTRLGLI